MLGVAPRSRKRATYCAGVADSRNVMNVAWNMCGALTMAYACPVANLATVRASSVKRVVSNGKRPAFPKKQGGKMVAKTDYAFRKAYGLCVECGMEDADKGYVTCWRCRMAIRERKALARERRRKQHLCLVCGQKIQRYWIKKGSPLCSACRQKERERNAHRIEQLKAAGICRHCGKRPVWDGEMCGICRDRLREYEHVRRCERRAA